MTVTASDPSRSIDDVSPLGIGDPSGWVDRALEAVRDQDRRPFQLALQMLIVGGMRTVARVEVNGYHHFPRAGGCVVAINHISVLDVPLTFAGCPRRLVCFVAAKWKKNRVADWFLRQTVDAIYVDRSKHDPETTQRALDALRGGAALGIAPEGVISPNGQMMRAKSGAAWFALKAKVPVIPVALDGHDTILEDLRAGRRAHVQLNVGAPVWMPSGGVNARTLREGTQQIMEAIAAIAPPDRRGAYGPNPELAADVDEILARQAELDARVRARREARRASQTRR